MAGRQAGATMKNNGLALWRCREQRRICARLPIQPWRRRRPSAAAQGSSSRTMGLLPSPEQSTGEGRQRRIEAHQVQALQLSLGRQQPIKRIAVGLPVATGVDAVMQLHG